MQIHKACCYELSIILGGKSCEYVSDVKMLRELVYIKHFPQIRYKTNLFLFFFLLDERKKTLKVQRFIPLNAVKTIIVNFNDQIMSYLAVFHCKFINLYKFGLTL